MFLRWLTNGPLLDPDTGGGAGSTPPPAAGATPPAAGTTTPPPAAVTFTPEQLAEVERKLAAAREEAATKVKNDTAAETERQRKETEAKALTEQGKFKELYEKAEAERQQAATDLAAERLNLARIKVAAKHNLSAGLADRLRGATEAELEADAAELKKLIPVEAAAPAGAPAGGRSAGGKAAAAPVEERKAALKKKSGYGF